MESILTSIKKLLGMTEEYTHFDDDIIIHINSTFSVMTRDLGVGPAGGFRITDDGAVWSDFVTDKQNLDDVKTYVYLKVKLIFDPPLNSRVIDAMEQTIKECEWRITQTADE